MATEHDLFSEAVRQEVLDLSQSLGETRKNFLGHQRSDSQTEDRAVKRDGGEHERRDKVSTLTHLNGNSGSGIQVRVRNKDIVTTVNDVGALVLLQLSDVEGSHLVNVSAELSVVTFNDFQTLGDGSSRERVRTSSEPDTRGDGEGLDEGVVGDNITTIGRESLGENTTDVVAGTNHIEVLFDTVASLSERTERVSFIHNNLDIKFITKLAGLGQVGNGTVSRVDSVNNKKSTASVLVAVLLHQIAEGFVVLVRELDGLGTSQLGTITETDVALLVHEDDTTLRAQVGNQVHASKETGSGEGAVFTVEEGLHSLVGLIDDGVLSQQQVRTVVSGSRFTDLLESIFTDFLVDMETPVRQRRHQSTSVVITSDLDGGTVVGLLEGKSRGEGPVFVDVLEVLVTQHLSSDINVGLQNGFVSDNRPLGLNGRLNQTTSQVKVSQITVVLALHEQFLGHLVLFNLLGDELGGVGHEDGSGSGEEEEQGEQEDVGEREGPSRGADGSDVNQTDHVVLAFHQERGGMEKGKKEFCF